MVVLAPVFKVKMRDPKPSWLGRWRLSSQPTYLKIAARKVLADEGVKEKDNG